MLTDLIRNSEKMTALLKEYEQAKAEEGARYIAEYLPGGGFKQWVLYDKESGKVIFSDTAAGIHKYTCKRKICGAVHWRPLKKATIVLK